MAFDLSQLEKLYLLAYSDQEYSNVVGPPFYALINPETYAYK